VFIKAIPVGEIKPLGATISVNNILSIAAKNPSAKPGV
jgi:hypothetical protein